MNLNKAMVIGNLVRDPEIRTTGAGASVASFSVATSIIWTDPSGQRQEKTEFHNIVAWKRLAEIVGQYLKKGSKVFIEGRLQTRDWAGQDGVKRYRTEIVAENMIMLDRAGGQGQAQGQYQNQNANYNRPPAPREEPVINVNEPAFNEPSQSSDDEIRVEDIPF